MLEAGWIEAPSHSPDMLLVMAAEGWLTLTEKGQARFQDESV